LLCQYSKHFCLRSIQIHVKYEQEYLSIGGLIMREVFADRDFRKLFVGNLFSGFGQGMTMIGISWYLVSTTGTATLLGSTMLMSGILSFLVGPYIGTQIDRFSRKLILQVENMTGFTVMAMLALWGFFGVYAEWMLIAIFMVTTLMYQLHYPAQSALVQERFSPRQYNQINSLLEIEGQTAAVLAGGAAGIMLEHYGLHIVLLVDALTYLFSFLMLSRMKYTFTLADQAKANAHLSWLGQFGQSWDYIRSKKGFLLFGISVLFPFIALMAGNLLAPVFVEGSLNEGVMIYSFSEVSYAVGAVAAGFLVNGIMRRYGETASMLANILLFAAAYLLIVLLPNGWMFVALYTLVGWCNASTRLIRQSIYMTMVPKEMMGRVISFLNSVGMLMRLLLIGTFTVMLNWTGAGTGYLLLAGLLLLAALGAMLSMRHLLPAARTEVAAGEG